MPRLVDYPAVVSQMTADGFASLYYNSGAFGFPSDVSAISAGWIGRADATLRPESLPLARLIPGPVEATLASMAAQAWLGAIGGKIWVTPRSHWAYELDFGSHTWMPAALESADVSSEQFAILCRRHDGSALEFEPTDSALLQGLVQALLHNLLGSDFQLSWPGHPISCTVHHHKQLWWTSTNPTLIDAINAFTQHR